MIRTISHPCLNIPGATSNRPVVASAGMGVSCRQHRQACRDAIARDKPQGNAGSGREFCKCRPHNSAKSS